MPALLIDYMNVISRRHDKLLQKLSNPPTKIKGFVPGLIVITNDENLQSISNLSYGEQRINYLNTEDFVQNIITYYYILYNDKRQICIMPQKCEEYLEEILKTIITGLPQTSILWVALDLSKNVSVSLRKFVGTGFNSPYITDTDPAGIKIIPSISLSKQNIPNETVNTQATLNKILHVMEMYKGDSCYLYAQLSPKAIRFLRKASDMGIVIDKNGKESQKEITGELIVKNVIKKDDKFVYVIDIDEGSVESGDNEDVDVSPTRYNFHSHPRQAYIRHSVNKAWPSSTDYLGYKKLGINTIFHCVATIEGVYIMSFTSYWGKNIKKINNNFVDSNFDIDHKEHYTPEEYVKKVNNILYHGYPIYKVRFFSWDNAGQIFKVFFPQHGSSCLTTQKIAENYEKMHKK